MSQHTPGPWRVGASGVTVIGGDILKGAWSFSVPYPSGNNNEAVAEANARLIAKAPELLDLLKMVIDGQRPGMRYLRALLREIEGQP